MPMPKRKSGESEAAFISRFMSDEIMRKDFPDRDQRLAVAMEQARKLAKSIPFASTPIDFSSVQDEAGRLLKRAYEEDDPHPLHEPLAKLSRGIGLGCDDLLSLADGGESRAARWAGAILEELEKCGELQRQTYKADFSVCKVSEDQRLVYAWASVIEENGEPVFDFHGDRIDVEELVKAAHRSLRIMVGKEMHRGEGKAEVVESMVLTKELQSALGIDLKKVGWLVAMKVHDDGLWSDIKAGRYPMLSIGGRGLREEIGADAA